MAAMTFDTLKFVETLEAGGVSTSHAKAISLAVQATHETADLVTQSDLREQELRFEAKLDKLEAKLEAKIDNRFAEVDKRFAEVDKRFAEVDKRFVELHNKVDLLGLKMTVRLGSMLVTGIGVVAALVKFL